MCVCVCMHICTYVLIYICTHTYIYIYIYVVVLSGCGHWQWQSKRVVRRSGSVQCGQKGSGLIKHGSVGGVSARRWLSTMLLNAAGKRLG